MKVINQNYLGERLKMFIKMAVDFLKIQLSSKLINRKETLPTLMTFKMIVNLAEVSKPVTRGAIFFVSITFYRLHLNFTNWAIRSFSKPIYRELTNKSVFPIKEN